MDDPKNTKTITGYCEPLSLRAGESIRCMASSHTPGPARLDLVRIICGDPTRSGPGFKEIEVPSDLPTEVVLHEQPLRPGSYGEVDLSGLSVTRQTKFKVHVSATRPDQDQTLLSVVGESGPMLVLRLSEKRLVTCVGKAELVLREQPLQAKRWYQVEIAADLKDGVVTGTLIPRPSCSPGQDVFERFEPHTASAAIGAIPTGRLHRCLFAASPDGDHFDGRLARPVLTLDAKTLEWDFSKDMGRRQIVDVSGHERHGLLHQLPARAVTGPDWDGSHYAWTAMPSHYDAIHFHSDDLYDAGWPVTAELNLPADLASGIYAFRLRTAHGQDRIPFFVRPAQHAPNGQHRPAHALMHLYGLRQSPDVVLKVRTLSPRAPACGLSTNTYATIPKLVDRRTRNTRMAVASCSALDAARFSNSGPVRTVGISHRTRTLTPSSTISGLVTIFSLTKMSMPKGLMR